MNNMTSLLFSTNVVATIFYLSVALISMTMYHSANKNFNSTGTKIHSFKSFEYLYKFIQITTLTVCILSIWIDYPYLYKIFRNTDLFKYLGVSISALGISLFALARFSLGNNYSPCYESYMPKSINTKGIYSLVRHPIYSSNLLLMVGIFISSGSLIILINGLVLFAYYFISAFIEERALSGQFSRYKMYKSRTGMFIPSIIKGISK
jgi:protein-S-isoprenylcysteine O-methyltransferase Ste14